jgi:uncharacterized protein
MKTPEKPSLFLRDKDLIRIKEILKSYVPSYVILGYGSRVNGTAHSASDLDLVIKSMDREPLDISTLVDLKEAFQNSNIPILIDIRDWARIPDYFKEEIEKMYYEIVL